MFSLVRPLKRLLPLCLPALLAFALASPTSLSAEESIETPAELLSEPALLPELKAAAEKYQLRTAGYDAVDASRALQVGDSTTALFITTDGGQSRQWIAELSVVPPTPEEAARKNDSVLYSAIGGELHYSSEVVGLDIRIIGPFSSKTTPEDFKTEWTVSKAHTAIRGALLRQGAAGACEVVMKLAASAKDPGSSPRFWFSNTPYNPKDIPEFRKRAEGDGVSDEEQKAFALGVQVMNEFTQTAQHIPGIFGIATEGMDWPSIWTMLRHLNFSIWTAFDWKATRSLEPSFSQLPLKCYVMPFRMYMFGSNVSRGGWILTEPQSPFIETGGFLGVWLQSVKHPERRMVLRMISAQRAKP